MKLMKKVFNVLNLHFRSCYTNPKNVRNKEAPDKIEKDIKQYYFPHLSNEKIEKITNIVGLNIGSNYIGFAKVNTVNKKIMNMGTVLLPENKHKLKITDLYLLAFSTLQLCPEGDHYILDEFKKSGKVDNTQFLVQSTRLQFIAMLMTLFNSNRRSENEHCTTIFLKPHLSGRLFNLLIGNEIVSSKKIVNEIFSGTFPSKFTTFETCHEAILNYKKGNSIEKDFMGDALLTALTFAELIIYKNKKCYDSLYRVSKKSEK